MCKAGAEHRKDGSIAKNPQRMGLITLEARLIGLERVRGIQNEVNDVAPVLGRPLINPEEEEVCIRELITRETWPQG